MASPLDSPHLHVSSFMADLQFGVRYGVVVDDTGSPGGAGYRYLPRDRKTWVGVIIPPDRCAKALDAVKNVTSEINQKIKISELHFVDIFGGRKQYKDLSWDERLSIFSIMTDLFLSLKLGCILQSSFTAAEAVACRLALDLPSQLKPFNLNKVEDLALFVLLVKIDVAIRRDGATPAQKAYCFIDEGWKKKNLGVQFVPGFLDSFAGNSLMFGRSSELPLLQLADFAGFVVNRSQIIYGRNEMNKYDLEFMSVCAPICSLVDGLVTQGTIAINNRTGDVFDVIAVEAPRGAISVIDADKLAVQNPKKRIQIQ